MEITWEQVVKTVITERSLQKIIFSKADDSQIKRTEGRLTKIKDAILLQLESFHSDGKATHRNIPLADAAKEILLYGEGYRQINLFTVSGECELLRSKKGKTTLRGASLITRSSALSPAEILSHDHKKQYILSDEGSYRFLAKLGVCDEEGRIFDRKRAKYRQINRFLEILSDVYPSLPADGTITVCDLCCGKSYLTFAVYYYLTAIKRRTVQMYGVDLKSDVMDFCRKTAESLGFDGMSFYSTDIQKFLPPNEPQLVISLHACDIATDIVLANAIRLRAKIILSTPCCHHEMMRQMDCDDLRFVSEHSILRQKLCDALTDALRAKRLESVGYDVTVMELIDPEETPKNALIRAIMPSKTNHDKMKQAKDEYDRTVAWLHADPTLNKLLSESEK